MPNGTDARQRRDRAIRERQRPRVVGIQRNGKRKWVVFTGKGTAEFTRWVHALSFANSLIVNEHYPYLHAE